MAERPLEAAFADAWGRRLSDAVVLAVSGGGDSMALMHLVCGTGARPPVVTVDHGLRPESASEAATVARAARSLGFEHETLRWSGPGIGNLRTGNLQASAREARYRLIADWSRERGIDTIVTGHTADDQAETVVMRLARGSGVDGLAAMRERTLLHGLTLFRPLLGQRRETLRAYLGGRGVTWHHDPSNDDVGFDRIKARQALDTLAPLGLTADRLARTAAHMARAADTLEALLDDWCAERLSLTPYGAAVVEAAPFATLYPELRLRLLARLLMRIGGQTYRPRFGALGPIAAALDQAEFPGAALHGCLILRDDRRIAVIREGAATGPPVPLEPANTLWDGRWRLDPAASPAGAMVGALGQAGWAALSPLDRPRTDPLTRLAMLATPAVWLGDTLLAAPVVLPDPAWPVSFSLPATERGNPAAPHSCP